MKTVMQSVIYLKICVGPINNLSHFVKNQGHRTDRLNRAIIGFNLCIKFCLD